MQIPDLKVKSVIIIDLDCVGEEEFQKESHIINIDSVFIIGYARIMDGPQIKHFRGLGYDMVLRRKKLLRNMDTILEKIIYVH